MTPAPARPPARDELLVQSARRAALRERFLAPANAILAYADMVLEDARRRGTPGVLADARRMAASAREVVRRLLEVEALMLQGAQAPDEAVARVRHAIRQPMTAIRGYAELLLEDEPEIERAALDRVVRATAELLQRLDGLGSESMAPSADLARAVEALGQGGTATAPVGRILVVDDDTGNRELLGDLLRRSGHEVALAAGGAEALQALAASSFDLVLLDLIMPGMTGFDVLDAMRRDPRIADVPVVVVSGLDDAVGLARSFGAGAQDFVRKPFDAPRLNARVAINLDRKRLRDRERVALERLEAEKRAADGLLANILPGPIVQRLAGGERVIADRLESATVLYADLVGFTGIAARLSPAQLVSDLDRIVSAFDELALELGVEKIKTVGDAYLAAAGVPVPRADHAAAAAAMALGMRDRLDRLGERLAEPWRLRVGLHSGPVIAGVIGKHKFAYDIWGDTVNVTARLEAAAAPGEIWVSEATMALLGDGFISEPRGPADLRGRGRFEAWALMARR